MYLQNKYTKCYYNIIERAKSRVLPKETYAEKHHIIPRSLGGNNSKNNIVALTGREHFICHLLLPKMTCGDQRIKMIHAAWRMCCKDNKGQNIRGYSITSRIFDSIKRKKSEIMRSVTGKDHPNYGRKTGRTAESFTKEWKENISKSKKIQNSGENNPMHGKTHTKESRAKQSSTRKERSKNPGWNIRPPCSEEKANKIKIANSGKRWVHNKSTKERKYIDPSLVSSYIDIGWENGLGPRY